MIFPDLQTLDGYEELIKGVGMNLLEKEDLGDDFAKHMDIYIDILHGAKQDIIAGFGAELYTEAEKGVLAWQKAAKEKWVSRGLWIAKKP